LTVARQSPRDVRPLLPEALEDKIFLCAGTIAPDATILISDSNGHLIEQKGLPLSLRFSISCTEKGSPALSSQPTISAAVSSSPASARRHPRSCR
jgi:hypothetical protein